MMTYSYLALGDSYTIGEGQPLYESFPYQAVQYLRKAGRSFWPPEIIARTGWTTDELNNGIAGTRLLPVYDFVSLLIGVNNEYRGRSPQEYAQQFEELIRQALRFAGGRPDRVFVLSIPDWGVSPFADSHLPDASGRDQAQITREIDDFNAIGEKITRDYQMGFIDITPHSRASASPIPPGSASAASLFAADGLHPSGRQYRYWAEQLAERIENSINAI